MVAVAIGGAAIIGGATSIISGNKAANAQKQAANQSIAEQQREYDQDRNDLAPWRNVGSGAISMLGNVYGIGPDGSYKSPQAGGAASPDYSAFFASPDYNFRLQQGQQAIERSQAAKGLLGSGATLKAANDYAQNTASAEYGNWFNKLAGLAGVGQSATNTTVAAGQNTANNISSAYQNIGNARASSYANTGSAINGTINNVLGAYLGYKGGMFSGGGTPRNAWGIVGGDGSGTY